MTSPFDAAVFLYDEKARVEYLHAALETNDIVVIRDAINLLARAIGMSQIQIAIGEPHEHKTNNSQ